MPHAQTEACALHPRRLRGRRAGGAGAVSGGARAAAAARSMSRSVGQALVGGPFTLTDHTGKRVTDQDFRGKLHAGVLRLHAIAPTCARRPAGDRGRARQARTQGGAQSRRCSSASIRSATRRPQLASYVQSFHPRLVGLTGIAGRDRCGRQGLSRLRQESARSQVDRRLHDRSFFDHLRHGSGRGVPSRTSRMPPVPTPWPSAGRKLRDRAVKVEENCASERAIPSAERWRARVTSSSTPAMARTPGSSATRRTMISWCSTSACPSSTGCRSSSDGAPTAEPCPSRAHRA